MNNVRLLQGDCRDVLKTLPDNSVDSIVTDPPYGLSFMGKKWDYDVPSVEVWMECLRVLKPGGHLLAFAGTRTQHRMACRIEDAGFEIRDMIAWVYGSGFPKSLDVSKAIDKAAGAEREVIEQVRVKSGGMEHVNRTNAATHEYRPDGYQKGENVLDITAPATDAAKQWEGWGTALKPALEPITVARKPFNTTISVNVQAFGTGALNIDGCRVPATGERLGGGDEHGKSSKPEGWARPWMDDPAHVAAHNAKITANVERATRLGRWPANFIHDGSEEVLECFPKTVTKSSGGSGSKSMGALGKNGKYGTFALDVEAANAGGLGDKGTPARFFYCPKASKRDRGEGNTHPTVKPTDLMRYLCRLVTPPAGVVLDPFMGSGSTGKAAVLEGFDFIGIDREPEHVKTSEGRIAFAETQRALPTQMSLI